MIYFYLMRVILCLLFVFTFSLQYKGTKLTCWDMCNNNCYQVDGIITDACLNQCNCTCDLNCKAICDKYVLGPRCEFGCGCLANRPYVGPFGQEDPEESFMEMEEQMIVPMQHKTVIQLENSKTQYKAKTKTQNGINPTIPPVPQNPPRKEYMYQNPKIPMYQPDQNMMMNQENPNNPIYQPENNMMNQQKQNEQNYVTRPQTLNPQPQLTAEEKLYFLLKACVDCIKMKRSSQYMNQLNCNVECDTYYKAKSIVENTTQANPPPPSTPATHLHPHPSPNDTSPIKLAQLLPEETGFGKMRWTTFFVVFLLGIAVATGAFKVYRKFKLFKELKNTYLSNDFSTSYIRQVN